MGDSRTYLEAVERRRDQADREDAAAWETTERNRDFANLILALSAISGRLAEQNLHLAALVELLEQRLR